MSAEQDSIRCYRPSIGYGPSEFYILTEHDSINDYEWICKEFSPDLTIVLYPYNLWTSHIRPLSEISRAHLPDCADINSAWWALTSNTHNFGFLNSYIRNFNRLFNESRTILTDCDIIDLYFNLSKQLLGKDYNFNKTLNENDNLPMEICTISQWFDQYYSQNRDDNIDTSNYLSDNNDNNSKNTLSIYANTKKQRNDSSKSSFLGLDKLSNMVMKSKNGGKSNELIKQNNNKDLPIVTTLGANVDASGFYLRGVRGGFIKETINELVNGKASVLDTFVQEVKQGQEHNTPNQIEQVSANPKLPTVDQIFKFYNVYLGSQDEHKYWEYLSTQMEEITWEFLFNPESYPPDPRLTRIFKQLYGEKLPFNGQFKHLPQSCFETLIHEMHNKLMSHGDDIKKIVVIVPNNHYSEMFCELWGTTKNEDLRHGDAYNEFDSWIHPRFRFFLYSGIGFGAAYGLKRLQFHYGKQNHKWLSRAARIGKIGLNTGTLFGIGCIYFASFGYLQAASGLYQGATMVKKVNELKKLDEVDDRAITRHFNN